MRIAVVSDIHGNLEAMKTAYLDILEREADSIICLGDLTGYGPYPNEVIDFIREKRIMVVLGNYDASVVEKSFKYIKNNDINKFCMPWAVSQLSSENIEYLKSLPQSLILKCNGIEIHFVHGSYRNINEYLNEDYDKLDEVMEEFNGDILVCGHTHIPYKKSFGDKLLINDGSIGKPKIGRPNGTYIIIDINKKGLRVEFIEFEYNHKKTIEAMKEKKLHTACIENVMTGVE